MFAPVDCFDLHHSVRCSNEIVSYGEECVGIWRACQLKVMTIFRIVNMVMKLSRNNPLQSTILDAKLYLCKVRDRCVRSNKGQIGAIQKLKLVLEYSWNDTSTNISSWWCSMFAGKSACIVFWSKGLRKIKALSTYSFLQGP